MKRYKGMIENVERFLFAAYRAQSDAAPSAGWSGTVMAAIRRQRALASERDGGVLFGRFAWRFSVAAGFVALLLLVYAFSNGFVDYQDLAVRFLENPVDFII